MKGLQEIKADNRPKKAKRKLKPKPKRKPPKLMTDNPWRELASDAIRSFREIAVLVDDQLRSSALSRVAQLERRLNVLAGQLEMFP